MAEECPMERFCKVVGSKWGCRIVNNFMNNEELGFNELLRMLNANPKTLSEKLRLLERNGLIKRRVVGGRPIRVMYSLTSKGKEVHKLKKYLSNWLKSLEAG
jgi:DNA-binding HxlR family transcriptional regulator